MEKVICLVLPGRVDPLQCRASNAEHQGPREGSNPQQCRRRQLWGHDASAGDGEGKTAEGEERIKGSSWSANIVVMSECLF